MSILRVIAVAVVATVATACVAVKPPPPPQIPELPAAPAAASIAGTWVLTTESRMGSHDADAVFTQAGAALAGKLVQQRSEMALTGSVKGDVVEFGFDVDVHGRTLTIDYTGTVSGDTMSGTVHFGPFGEGKWSGTRKAP